MSVPDMCGSLGLLIPTNYHHLTSATMRETQRVLINVQQKLLNIARKFNDFYCLELFVHLWG